MKTSLDLPDNLLNEVKVRARQDGCDLNDAVIGLLRHALDTTREACDSRRTAVFKLHPQTGLPYIKCRSDASARSMRWQELMVLDRETLNKEDDERTGLPAN